MSVTKGYTTPAKDMPLQLRLESLCSRPNQLRSMLTER